MPQTKPEIQQNEIAAPPPNTFAITKSDAVTDLNPVQNFEKISSKNLSNGKEYFRFSFGFMLLTSVRTLWFDCDNLFHSIFHSVSSMAEQSSIIALFIGFNYFFSGYSISICAEISKSLSLQDLQAAKVRGFWGLIQILMITSMLGGLCYFFAERLAKIILNQSLVSSIYVIENDNQLVTLLRIFGFILPSLGVENFLNSFLIALGKEKLLILINFVGYYAVGFGVWNLFQFWEIGIGSFWWSVLCSVLVVILAEIGVLIWMDWKLFSAQEQQKSLVEQKSSVHQDRIF